MYIVCARACVCLYLCVCMCMRAHVSICVCRYKIDIVYYDNKELFTTNSNT